jgi:flagellar biosynthesis protein FlhB
MEKNSAQERTHDATPGRLEKLRKEGTVLRSRDLITFMLLGMGAIGIFILGDSAVQSFMDYIRHALTISKDNLVHFDKYYASSIMSIGKLLLSIFPLFFLLLLGVLLTPILLGGFIFTSKAFHFQLSRMNPGSGLKRMFSSRVITEILKGFLKLGLILSCGLFFLWQKKMQILHFSDLPVERAIINSIHSIEALFFILILSLLIIAAIDVPIEYFQFKQKTKMSLEEIREEQRETDGNPEQKQKRRAMAQRAVRQRLIFDVPKANVIVTNPTHYAVGLKYDAASQSAPIVVVKGKGWVAQQIREIAAQHKILVYSAPPLARSLFHTTEIAQEIPADLYMAVALVLTYVYQLKQYEARQAARPEMVSDLPIPDHMRYEEE